MEIPKGLTKDYQLIKMLFNAKVQFHLFTDEKEVSFTMYKFQFEIIRKWAYSIIRQKYPWYTMTEKEKSNIEIEIIFKENKINPQYKKISIQEIKNPYYLTNTEKAIQDSYKKFMSETWQEKMALKRSKKP